MFQIVFTKIYESALAGDTHSQFLLGSQLDRVGQIKLSRISLFHPDYFRQSEHIQAAQWFRLAAEKGHAGAQYLFGRYNKMGLGVVIDTNESDKYIKMAAAQGHPEALLECGEFKKAAEQGNTQALYELSAMYWSKPHYPEKKEEYEKNTAEGYAYCLAAIHFGCSDALEFQVMFELRGADKEMADQRAYEIIKEFDHTNAAREEARKAEEAKALEEFKKTVILAENGCSDAQFKLGTLYANGIADGKNGEQWLKSTSRNLAIKWLVKAAESGHELAAHGLGLCYLFYIAPNINLMESYSWFSIAGETTEDSLIYKSLLDTELNVAQIKRARERAEELKNALDRQKRGLSNSDSIWIPKV